MHGQEGGHLPSPGKCAGLDSLQLQHFVSHKTKRTINFAARHILPAQTIPKLQLRARALLKNQLGELTVIPWPLQLYLNDPLCSKERADWTSREGRGGNRRGVEEWRDWEGMERKEEVDFAVFARVGDGSVGQWVTRVAIIRWVSGC